MVMLNYGVGSVPFDWRKEDLRKPNLFDDKLGSGGNYSVSRVSSDFGRGITLGSNDYELRNDGLPEALADRVCLGGYNPNSSSAPAPEFYGFAEGLYANARKRRGPIVNNNVPAGGTTREQGISGASAGGNVLRV